MRRLLGVVGAVLAIAAGSSSPAAADDAGLAISHVEPADGEVRILLSVPAGAQVDLDGIAVSFDGESAETDAAPADSGEAEDAVRRTTILAIDTSESMQANGRFEAARVAANTYLDTVPEGVFVGIVTFDGAVRTAIEPTTDRDAAKVVINGLELAFGTVLNPAVITATKVAGTEGQRNVLVLSDGRDASKVPLANVEKAIADSGVKVDVVALDQAGKGLAPLEAMAAAGQGQVIPADPDALTAAFTAEADVLARQVLVTAQVPASVTKDEATVQVTVPTADETLTAQTFSIIGTSVDAPPEAPRAQDDNVLQIPKTVMYGGVAAIGFGLLALLGSLMMMATASGMPKTAEQRIAAYGANGGGVDNASEGATFNLDQAKDAAASMLSRNKGLEARIEARLEAAGSSFKSSEWFLLHGAITMLSGLVGLLVSGGSLVILVGFLFAGALVPWLWLGWKRKRRVKAFNSGLADTLTLMSGSLTAGMSLSQSVDTVVNEGVEPISSEFKRMLIETRLGVPLESAMEGVATRIGSKDFAWTVMAIRIQREVGGNLAELLNTVAATLRERDYLRRQVQTLAAEGKLSGYILGGLPPGMLVYLMIVRRDYVMPLFTDPMGWAMLGGAIFLLLLGGFMMSRIIKVEV